MNRSILSRACNRESAILLLLTAALIWPFGGFAQAAPHRGAAQSDVPILALCIRCDSGARYANAAAERILHFRSEDPFESVPQLVHVVNVSAKEAPAYRVTRIVRDPDPHRLGDETVELDVVAVDSDPVFVEELVGAMEVVLGLWGNVYRRLSPEELKLPDRLDSAIDLIGPENSAAGGNRQTVEHALSGYYEDLWQQNLDMVSTPVLEAVELFMQSHGVALRHGDGEPQGAAILDFADGTEVFVRVTSIGQHSLSAPEELYVRFETDQGSVRAPGQFAFPSSAGALKDWPLSTDDPHLARQLTALVERLGARIVEPEPAAASSDQCTTNWACAAVGEQPVCEITYSDC